MGEPWLLIETSGRRGRIGLARGNRVVQAATLDETRRHARDLTAVIGRLLTAEGLTPKQLFGVMASQGPGSYTGLRVGLMTAKALGYASGCRFVPVPTFPAVAEQAPAGACVLDVIGDALQGLIYIQRFTRDSAGAAWQEAAPLRIEPGAEWAGRLTPDVWVSGPDVGKFAGLLPDGTPVAPEADRVARVESLLAVGLRLSPASREELLRCEPLYLRGSSAEEKASGHSPERERRNA